MRITFANGRHFKLCPPEWRDGTLHLKVTPRTTYVLTSAEMKCFLDEQLTALNNPPKQGMFSARIRGLDGLERTFNDVTEFKTTDNNFILNNPAGCLCNLPLTNLIHIQPTV